MASAEKTKTVLFVCTGNTCRSPMAEGLMRAAVSGRKDIKVGSAGVAAMPGQGASRETLQILRDRNAGMEKFRSRQVDESLLEDADLIIAMTDSHAAMVRRVFPGGAGRVSLLCDFLPGDEEELAGADVPDPIGMGRAAYEDVAEIISLAIPGILRELEED